MSSHDMIIGVIDLVILICSVVLGAKISTLNFGMMFRGELKGDLKPFIFILFVVLIALLFFFKIMIS